MWQVMIRCLAGVYAEEFAHTTTHIAVACAVEAVTTNAVFGIIFIRKSIHKCLGGHSLVESGIKHTNLGYIGHQLGDSVDTGHVGRVVQGRDIVALADFFLLLRRR